MTTTRTALNGRASTKLELQLDQTRFGLDDPRTKMIELVSKNDPAAKSILQRLFDKEHITERAYAVIDALIQSNTVGPAIVPLWKASHRHMDRFIAKALELAPVPIDDAATK